MNDIVIKAENLGKLYRIGSAAHMSKTFREAITETVAAPFRRIRNAFSPTALDDVRSSEFIWALKDVNFEIKRGEVIGIIGRNGAGKSTLLKILSRITEPTEGRVILKGRVGSLLEVGTGFHSELTGEENIYLSGTILGMSSNEISRKFDEIVAFAEMGKFIHSAVKYFSSGMYMRLAFAVAAHLETEILLVDEVLAVGDASFQKKCLGKMEDMAQGGRTVLFVSHNMAAIDTICQRGIFFDNGHIIFSGSVHDSVAHYLDKFAETVRNVQGINQRKDRTGTGEIKLNNFYIENEAEEKVEVIRNGQTARFVFEYITKLNKEVENVDFHIVVRSQSGDLLFQIGTRFTGEKFKIVPAKGKFVCNIKKFPLVPGRYRLDTYLVAGGNPSDYMLCLSHIDVVDGDYYNSGYLVFEKESKFLVDGSISYQSII